MSYRRDEHTHEFLRYLDILLSLYIFLNRWMGYMHGQGDFLEGSLECMQGRDENEHIME